MAIKPLDRQTDKSCINRYESRPILSFCTIKSKKKLSFFTLAEVLITLGIIGVVAAFTIPTLMNTTQDNEFKSAYKKEFSVLSQAVSSIANDNGGNITDLVASSTAFRDLIVSKTKTLKTCANGASMGSCWATTTSYMDGTIKTDMWDMASAVWVDGTSIMMASAGNCQLNTYGTPAGETTCGVITIDVNGLKPPNRFGKDMYNVHLLRNRILPFGTQGDAYQNRTCPGTGWDSGLKCSATYLAQ